MSDFIKKYWEKITTNKVLSAFIVLIIAVVIVGSISISKYDDITFLEGILIEAHGMLLDILIIGVFILWLNRLGERRMEVQRYKNEIDDFRYWESDEAKFRIVGNINRLNRLKISAIDLYDCTLNKAHLKDAMLQGAELTGANLQGAYLRDADLRGANLAGANLRNANLQGVNFEGAQLFSANFCDADLTLAILNLEQIANVNTLYKAIMDDELRKQIEENYRHLLTKPDWLEEEDE